MLGNTLLAEKGKSVGNLNYWLIKQAHIVWVASIVNIGLGFVIPGFDFMSKSISHVALETPFFAYTHRTADIIIGVSMCLFAIGVQRITTGKFSSAAISCFLLGVSMISAGIWTLESPLHLLYNLSIFMIILPIAVALEFKNVVKERAFENLCVALTLLHVLMFWLIYAGFIAQEFNGLIQRMWAIPTMGWFGIVVFYLLREENSVNKQINGTKTRGLFRSAQV